jgi:hypothetical protein
LAGSVVSSAGVGSGLFAAAGGGDDFAAGGTDVFALGAGCLATVLVSAPFAPYVPDVCVCPRPNDTTALGPIDFLAFGSALLLGSDAFAAVGV